MCIKKGEHKIFKKGRKVQNLLHTLILSVSLYFSFYLFLYIYIYIYIYHLLLHFHSFSLSITAISNDCSSISMYCVGGAAKKVFLCVAWPLPPPFPSQGPGNKKKELFLRLPSKKVNVLVDEKSCPTFHSSKPVLRIRIPDQDSV